MSGLCARRFPGFSRDLSSTEVKSTSLRDKNAPSSTSRSTSSLSSSNGISPVYAAIMEGDGVDSGQIGLAVIDSSTMDVHLFSFVDHSSFKKQLQVLKPDEVIISDPNKGLRPNSELYEVVRSLCPNTTFSAVQRRLFDESHGLSVYRSVPITKLKPVNVDEKGLSLSAFSALIKFTSYLQSLSLPPSSLTVTFHEDSSFLVCPLCEKDETAERCLMGSIREIQLHFFYYHWQVHGVACQFCGTMFSTAEELRTTHSDCQEWEEWNAARVSEEEEETGKLEMECCRMFLCCADCGWYTTLSEDGRTISEEGTIQYLKTFFSHHNNEGLLGMLVYFPAKPRDEMTSIRFKVTSMAGGNPTTPCVHCDSSATFLDPSEANEHYFQKHGGQTLVCEECKAETTTKYLLEQHQMSHLHDNSYFADFLTNSARIFPPPTNRCDAPRIGWKYRTTNSVASGGIGKDDGYDLIGPNENVKRTNARLVDKKRRKGKRSYDLGFRKAPNREESEMAREVREKLISKYADCEGMRGFDDPVWLKDEDSLKFKEWMDYWESEEGRKKGGPPKRIDVTPSIMRIPSVEVELQFIVIDVISGFLLNDNVYYCIECNSIVKGEQAEEHLKQKGSAVNPCSTNVDGGIEENPAMNDNMYPLYLRSASSPYSSLICPLCPLKSCSITGLRVHIMVDHRVFVQCNRVEEEKVTDSMSFNVDIRSSIYRRKKGMSGPASKDKSSDPQSTRNRDMDDSTVEKERPDDATAAAAASSMLQPATAANQRDKSSSGEIGEMGDDDIIEVPPTAVMHDGLQVAAAAANELMQQEMGDKEIRGKMKGSEGNGIIEVPKSAADAAEVPLQRPTASTKRAKPIGDDIPDGEDDEEAVKYVLMKIVHTVVRNEEKERIGETIEDEGIVEKHIPASIANDEDEDVVMVEQGDMRDMAASIRVEANDTIVGGGNEPGYKDEEEEIIPNQSVIRVFTPDSDDDVCVVAEVENQGCSTAAATINKQREKKFSCPKCSSKFMTRATLAVHTQTDHQFDAGANMIEEELGIPLSAPIWICMVCSIAFPTPELKKFHADQHGRHTNQKCDTCSGVAYNEEVMSKHLDREKEKRLGYICGECKIEFSHDTNLHEHNESVHGVVPFFFCKWCDMGSTDSLPVYIHFMSKCPRGYTHLVKTYKDKAQDHASKCIGVCPASQLHFQPINLKNYKTDFAQHPDKFVVPSLCNHRSMLVATEQRVTCDTCRCLESVSSHAALYELRTGRKWGKISPAICTPPLSVVRRVYDKWKNERINEKTRKANQTKAESRSKPGPSRECQASTSRAPTALSDYGCRLLTSALCDQAAQRLALNSQQVLHRMDDRLHVAGQIRGETGRENGGGGERPIAAFSMGNGSRYGGGAREMRGTSVSTGVSIGSQRGEGTMRGDAFLPSPSPSFSFRFPSQPPIDGQSPSSHDNDSN